MFHHQQGVILTIAAKGVDGNDIRVLQRPAHARLA